MLACQATPLTTYHIPGYLNTMADDALHSSITQPMDREFLTHFNLRFPLPQAASWILCSLNTKTIGKLYSMLQTTTSPWVWWQQTTQNASIIGGTGKTLFGPLLMTTFRASLAKNKYPCAKPSLNGHGKANWGEEHKSKPDRYRMRSQPLARASNWKGTGIPSTNQEQQNTTYALNDNWNHSNKPTCQCNGN